MRTAPFNNRTGTVAAAVMLAVVFAACRPKPPAAPPAPVPPPPEVSAPAEAASPSVPSTATVAAREPELATMTLAQANSKLGVPVDLRYQFDGDVETGRPVTLYLAAVPRVTGSNLQMSIKETAGVRTTQGELRAQKATASTAYRQQASVTRMTEGATELRVLVTMDLPEGSAFSFFSVPF